MQQIRALIEQTNANVFLVNTGWLGPQRPGRSRISIKDTISIIQAVRQGNMNMTPANWTKDPIFNFEVPKFVPGVNPDILNVEAAWGTADYKSEAEKLMAQFVLHDKRN